jgi:2-polyprenyl-6-methoxyphenol hydroxylase-like FAD-dependent oxidoreductase
LSRNESRLDALVFGAGVAGCAAAIELRSAGWKVGVIHHNDRTFGLESVSPEGAKSLSRLSISHGTSFSHVRAWWGSTSLSKTESAGARIVRRSTLAEEMRLKVQQRDIHVAVVSGFEIIRAHGGWDIKCNDSLGRTQHFGSTYILDATGRACIVGRSLGARRQSSDQLCCISASIHDSAPVGTWTEDVFDGWWNLCSDGNQGTLTFYTMPQILRAVKSDPGEFLSRGGSEIKNLVTGRIGAGHQVRPCGSSRLVPSSGPGWLAIGDAAMTVQPLSSAGIAGALRDAQTIVFNLALSHQKLEEFCQFQFETYVQRLAEHYSMVTRWPNSSFWSHSVDSKPFRVSTVPGTESSFRDRAVPNLG